MGRNGQVILELQGSKKDFVGAWFARLLQMLLGVGVLWLCKLIYVAVMYLVTTFPPMQADVTKLKKDVEVLKESVATKAELAEVELRVKKEISEKIKNSPIITGTQGK